MFLLALVDDNHSTDREVGSVAILIDRHHGRGVTMERHTTTFFISYSIEIFSRLESGGRPIFSDRFLRTIETRW